MAFLPACRQQPQFVRNCIITMISRTAHIPALARFQRRVHSHRSRFHNTLAGQYRQHEGARRVTITHTRTHSRKHDVAIDTVSAWSSYTSPLPRDSTCRQAAHPLNLTPNQLYVKMVHFDVKMCLASAQTILMSNWLILT